MVAHRFLGSIRIAVANALQNRCVLLTHTKVVIGRPQRYEPETERFVVQCGEELRQHAILFSPRDEAMKFPDQAR